MAKVEIYTTPFCGFCMQAKRLLGKKGVEYAEINVALNGKQRQQMIERSGGDSKVPQIFIDDKHIGGCDELYELDFDQELDPLLGIGGSP